MSARFTAWAALRCHVLLPHEVVGAFRMDKPTWNAWTIDEYGGEAVHSYDGRPALMVTTTPTATLTRVTVRALRDIWIQEPGLTATIQGDGFWRGFGPRGKWTSAPYPLHQKDAHRSTIHFSRAKSSAAYTVGVEFREPGGTGWRLYSDGGFLAPLLTPLRGAVVPWEGCEVFSTGYELRGTCSGPEALRRWELAGAPPDLGQMHFVGWTGGAGAVVNERGRTPPPGRPPTAADGYDRLWQPASWRKLGRGQTIVQTIRRRRL